MSENKDFVINVCKNVLKTASEHLGGMLVLKQADMTAFQDFKKRKKGVK